ncbi:hypothetical protein [Spongiibacter marinus]|nr:hypothetical protein [Spongiibacter marinus]MBM7422316.1 hypothetical protein [Spongiibacter marinus]
MDQLEDEYQEARAEWIREQLNDDEADEFTEGWDDFSDEYDELYGNNDFREYDYDDDLIVSGKTPFELFEESIEATREILNSQVSRQSSTKLLVMLHAHIVASVEAYLSATFIKNSLSTEEHMRRLVESDPEFAKRKFTIKEIFTKRDQLKDDLSQYLRDLIFHDLAKVKPMFNSVLDIDFGDIDWLFKAVATRHHCVHRAGYDKDGNQVPLTKDTVEELISKGIGLVGEIEASITSMPEDGEFFWKSK